MSRTIIIQEEIREKDMFFLALYVETKNAGLFLLSEGEDQLGTLAVAIPQKKGLAGPPLSSILLGDRNVILARLFAERLVERVNKIVLVSVFTKIIGEREAGPIFMKLIKKVVEKRAAER